MKVNRSRLEVFLSFVLCFTLLFSMAVPAFATEGEGAEQKCEHEDISSEVTSEASCTAPGLMTFSCSCGGYSYDEEIPATGHNYVNGICSGCNAEEPDPEPQQPVCTKAEDCPAGNHDAECLKKLADDAAAAKAAADQAKIDEVNGLIVALPNVVTTGNYDAVMAQLNVIMAKQTEMGELWNQLDLVKLNAVINATYAPMTLDDCTCTASCADSRNTDCPFCGDTSNVCGKGPAVAKIGDVGYESLELAFSSAGEGDTITLQSNATPVLTSQRAITKASAIDLGGKTLTLTEDDLYFGTTVFRNGNIVVDPSVSPSTAVFWMFADQTLTFDAVTITATGVTGTYLIGLDGNNADLNLLNGSQIVVDNSTALDLDIICVNASTGNDILISNSKVTVNNLDGRVFFRGNYTVNGNSDIDLSGITKAGFRIEAGQTLTIADTATVDIVGEPRDGGIHLTDLSAVYTKADTATVNATLEEPVCYAKIDDKKFGSLQEAIDAAVDGDEIVFQTDITKNVTVTQKDGIKLVIDGNNKNFTGVMSINGQSQQSGSETLTVKNVNFYAAEGEDCCIESNSGSERYAHNVTISNCNFYGNTSTPQKAAAVRHRTGGTKNWTISGCTVDSNMHSLIQTQNVVGKLTITDCTVNSKNGINLNQSTNVEISDNKVNVSGYAIRAGADGAASTAEKNFVITGNTLSTTHDGNEDAVIIIRGTAQNAALNINENAITAPNGAAHIMGTTAATDITADANYWGEGKTGPAVEGEPVSVVSYYEDAALTQLAQGVGAVAENNGQYYSDIQTAVDTATAGDKIVVLKEHTPTAPIVVEKNLTIDFANNKMACTGIYPVIRVQGGATLTVKNGSITNDDYVFVLGASDSSSAGNLNIESGTYHGATTVVSVTKGELNISGGSFSADPYNGGYDFLLNCYDPNRADCKITVKGGSFANFNPANNAAEGAGTNFVDGDYASVADGSNYTVKPLVTITFNDAEMVLGNAQPSYTYSSNASVHGYTVEVTPASITINDNTSTYGITAATVVVKSGSTDVTANCKVEVTPGTLTVKTAAAKLTSGSTDTYYETLASAVAAANANPGSTLTLISDNDESIGFTADTTLVLDGKNQTGAVSVNGATLSISNEDLVKLGSVGLNNASVKVGDTLVAMAEGTVKADSTGKLTADPAENAAVAVNSKVGVVVPEGGVVEISAAGETSVPAGSRVDFLGSKYFVYAANAGVVSKDGALSLTPDEVKDDNNKGVGYGAVIIGNNDDEKYTGVLVPVGATVTLKLNSSNEIEVSTPKGVEDPIIDEGAVGEGYLTVDPAKKSFYNKSFVTMTFTCNGFIDAVESIEVSSTANKYYKQLTTDECTITQGSTIVKLKNSYLRNLALGTYTLTFNYKDGQSASATFYIVDTPLTGDNSNIAPFAALMAVSAALMAAAVVLLKKRRA